MSTNTNEARNSGRPNSNGTSMEVPQVGSNLQVVQGQTRRRTPTVQARYWLGTINEGHGMFVPPRELNGGLLVWVRGQQERGDAGNIHWQVFASFSRKVTLSKVKQEVFNGHWEPSRSEAAEAYVWKEDTRIEGTQFEVGSKAFKRNSAEDWGRVRDLAVSGKVKTILEELPEIGIKHYRTLKQIAVDFLQCPQNLSGPSGKWVWGPPGVGKSHWVREQWGSDLYIKAQNKWWDGYQGQKFVLLDDFDSRMLGHYLKIWMDAYSFTAETKGGTIQIRPNLFIITSNYDIPQLFEDPVVAAAIARRCQKIYIPFRRY